MSLRVLEKISPRQLFLIDCLGALVSATMLGIVLVYFENFFGMPKETLYWLAALAALFAVYSFFCYMLQPEQWQLFMRIIAIVNLSYCCLTIACMFIFREQLTVLGFAYFIGEIIIILVLASFELKMASNLKA